MLQTTRCAAKDIKCINIYFQTRIIFKWIHVSLPAPLLWKNCILLSDLLCIWAAARPQQAMAYHTDVTRQVVAAKNVISHLISSTSSLWHHLIIWYHPIAILLILRFQAMKLVAASTSNVKILDAFTLYCYLCSILVQKLKSHSLLHMLGQWTLPVL